MANLHISISAEPIFSLGTFEVTNSMLTTVLLTSGLVIFSLLASQKIKHTNRPKGIQAFLESIIESVYTLVTSVVGENRAKVIFPFVATFFIFILLSNWSGLLPGVGSIGLLRQHPVVSQAASGTHSDSELPKQAADQIKSKPEDATSEVVHSEETPKEPKINGAEVTPGQPEVETEFVPLFRGPTADINTTLALAIVSVFMTQVIGLKYLGLSYIGKFINFKSPVHFFIGILELVAELAKIVSFAFRLFGNIFAGEVLLTVMAFLIPLVAPLPFIGLEIFVGIIQALVFAMLTLVFMNLATVSHEEH